MTQKTENTCRHIKTNGRRCRSPRVNQLQLCYFHARLFERERIILQPLPPHNPAHPLPAQLPSQLTEIELPSLEDAESIQVSISLLVSALARNRIDSKRTAVLLYGLQLASTNSKSVTTEPFAAAVIRSVVESPHGTDYAAEPESEPAIPELPAEAAAVQQPADASI